MRYVTEQTVELVGSLGNDLTVVNAARVSFKGQSTLLSSADVKLLDYLAAHKHYSPFRHVILQFRLKVPEFVARQLYKHVVGIEGTSTHPTKDHAWNELSGRYKEYDEIYLPVKWNQQDPKAKQCSAQELDPEKSATCQKVYEEAIQKCMDSYAEMLKLGVSREQARILLPLTVMTEIAWTASLQAVHNFVVLRNAPDAQREIRELAAQIERHARHVAPYAFSALIDPAL